MTDYNITFVDTVASLDDCLKDISPIDESHSKEVAIDLEGVDLCRMGRVALLQVVANGSTTVWIIDITTLGKEAFDHASACGKSLRGVLEGTNTTKLFFDVRNDSDALFAHYQIRLQNVYDVQLLEVATRRSNNMRVPFVSGLAKCIQSNFGRPAAWLTVKEEGTRLFAPGRGGSYEVFEQRPINPILLQYCAQDVTLLFGLKNILESKLGRNGNWKDRVLVASSQRVAESMTPTYNPHGRHKAIAQVI